LDRFWSIWVLNRQQHGGFERWHPELRTADDCARMAA
jgi:hypothetical protein